MLRVGWSCLALPAFSTSRFNVASILHMFTMLWHDSVAIFWDDDEVIVMVTREFCNRMTYFFIYGQPRVHFQTWWWYHRPILWYIKMILAKLGVKEREKANSLKFCSYIQYNIVLYRDSSSRDRVDFLVSQTDTTSYFVRKILVEKTTLSTTWVAARSWNYYEFCIGYQKNRCRPTGGTATKK